MFVGRERELEQLRKELKKKGKSAILVYGKRRIGKSTLIAEALKGFDGAVISHICVQTSYDGNLELLYRSVGRVLGLPTMKFGELSDLFAFLGSLKKQVVLVLDEYPYLKESKKKKEVDSLMQAAIDNMPSNVKLILCGSFISVLRELMEEDNPLFGRFTQIIHLKEFDYYDASKFYPNASVRTKIERYAVFGGSPYVLSNLDSKASLEDNIIELLLPETSIYRTYIESIVLQEIRKTYDARILELIGNGRRKYSELVSALNESDNGYMDKQLKILLSMETIQKEFPINRKNDKKKSFYSISDNLMRFYFTFIFGNQSIIDAIGEKNFYRQEILPVLNEFISIRFEEMTRQYFSRLARAGMGKGISDIGTYWYDDPVNHTSGQFDCVIKRKDIYEFYECKFHTKPMTKKDCEKESEQVAMISEITPGNIGFVCSSGFSFTDEKMVLISGEEMFGISK